MNFVKVDSFTVDNLKRRVIKFLRLGKKDVQTSFEVAPYGIDAGVIKDMVAVYAPTGEQGKTVIVGYLNKQQLAAKGELHLYSTDENGTEKFRIKIRNNGTVEMGGTAHNLMRYTPANQGLQDFKNLIQVELVKIQTGITGVGGAYTPGTLTVDISQSKIDEIKTL